MTPEALRALFPALRAQAYLNAAASSPLATPVVEAAVAQLRDAEAHGDAHFLRWLAFKEELRGRLARFLGAAPRQLAFTPSTSMSFCAVAELLWRRGVREVLTFEGEFPSTTVPLLRRGLALRVVKPRADGSYPLDDVERALAPGVGAVAVSVVQYASGFLTDAEGLSALCRARGLPLALNGAQAVGQVPVDVGAVGADFLCATSHKWLMGGHGTGLLYVKAGWLEELGLPWAGWFSPPDELRWQTFPGSATAPAEGGFTGSGVTTRREAAALEAGGGNWAALYGLGAGLGLHEAVGITVTRAHILGLQAQLRAGLRARGFVPNAPDDAARGSGICVVPVRGDALSAVRALLGEGVAVTPRGGGVRLSTHVFNDAEDVARALAAIDRLGLKPG